jgi:aminomethyltransferase
MGAKFGVFGGWEMPMSYPLGTISEHNACRNDAALFDVSHLGTVRVHGAKAFDTLQQAFTNDLAKIGPGRAQYTHSCNDHGGVVDDIIVWWRNNDVFDVMPNASNTDSVRSVIGGQDVTSERAILAVQGPRARERLSTLSEAAAAVRRFRVEDISILGVNCTVAGTGYTGEDGVEISVPINDAERVARAIVSTGVVAAGLAARDTLRLEAALPLHGHELSPDITTLEADLGWVIGWQKPQFRGREALERQSIDGVQRILCGIRTNTRRPPREGAVVRCNNTQVGIVTSGNFSPILGVGIALALVAPQHSTPGTRVSVGIRDTELDGEVVERPFVRR